MSGDKEFLTMQESATFLGVSRYTIWRLVKEHGLTVYQSPASKRSRLLRSDALETLRRPQPIVAMREQRHGQ